MRYALLLGFLGFAFLGCSQSARERCLDRGGQWDEASRQCIMNQSPQIALQEQDSTEYYTYKITYPEIIRSNATLRQQMKEYAAQQKQQFLELFDRDSMPRSASYPWDFRLDYTVEDSAASFVSILGSGYAFSGGAHGNHFFHILNYDRAHQRLVSFEDLFADSTALAPISDYVRPQLREHLADVFGDAQGNQKAIAQQKKRSQEWITEGTKPMRKNYQYIILSRPKDGQPSGLTVLFPPYQVAPYSAGEQKVFVPASVFKDKLTAEYEGWFSAGS